MLYQTNTVKVKESRPFEYCTFFKDIRKKNKTRILNTSNTKVKTPPPHIKCEGYGLGIDVINRWFEKCRSVAWVLYI